jgi:hypothetical protein
MNAPIYTSYTSFLRKAIGIFLALLVVLPLTRFSLPSFLAGGHGVPLKVQVQQNNLVGWSFDQVTNATTSFLNDASAPLGHGALFVETDENGRGTWKTNHGAGVPLSLFHDISYSTYSDPANLSPRAPYLAIKVNLVVPPSQNSATILENTKSEDNQSEDNQNQDEPITAALESAVQSIIPDVPSAGAEEVGVAGYLVYDPAFQGSSLTPGWSNWNPTSSDSKWYWWATNPGDSWMIWPDGTPVSLLSWDEIQNKFPGSHIADGAEADTFSITAGNYWQENARVAFDNLNIDAGEGANVLFDFEPDMRIVGRKVNDLNYDGVIDQDEPGIPGWQMSLYQLPNAPWKTDGNNVPLATTTTCGEGSIPCPAGLPEGSYWFNDLPNDVTSPFESLRSNVCVSIAAFTRFGSIKSTASNETANAVASVTRLRWSALKVLVIFFLWRLRG